MAMAVVVSLSAFACCGGTELALKSRGVEADFECRLDFFTLRFPEFFIFPSLVIFTFEFRRDIAILVFLSRV
jgi:hypothetical protein